MQCLPFSSWFLIRIQQAILKLILYLLFLKGEGGGGGEQTNILFNRMVETGGDGIGKQRGRDHEHFMSIANNTPNKQ
jgi:hypothetical protein